MFCEKCGAKLDPGDKFCMNCGHKVTYNIGVAKEESTPTTEEVAVTGTPLEEVAKVEEPATEKVTPAVETAPEPEIPDHFWTPDPADQKPKESEPEVPYDRVIKDKTGSPEQTDAESASDEAMLSGQLAVEETEASDTTEEESKPKKSGTGKKVAIILGAILLALILGATMFFVITGLSPMDLLPSNKTAEQTVTVTASANDSYDDEDYTEEETTRKTTTEAYVDEDDEDDGVYYRVSVGRNNRLSLRAQPDEDSTKLDRIDNGTRLYITEIRGNWGRTTYDGQAGWVCITKDGDTYCVRD